MSNGEAQGDIRKAQVGASGGFWMTWFLLRCFFFLKKIFLKGLLENSVFTFSRLLKQIQDEFG